MQRLLTLFAAGVMTFGLSNAALASSTATTTTGSADPSTVLESFASTITGTTKCTGAHSHGSNTICVDNTTPVTAGTLSIQRALDGSGEHGDCGAQTTWNTIASGTPDGSGNFSTPFDTTGLGGSVLGFRASYGGDPGKFGTSDSVCFDLTIIILSPPSATKNFVSGPTEADHTTPIDLVALLGLNAAPTPDPTAPDDGVIGVGLKDGEDGVQQFFTFEIVLVNQPAGTVVIDTVPAEFDLDDDPVSSDDGKCLVTASRNHGAGQGKLPKLEPEFLNIEVVDLDPTEAGDNTCTITVKVKTDGNPGHVTETNGEPENDDNNEWSLFEPTGCTLVSDPSDPPMVDTIALNDGLKVFDPVTGDRISGPEGSLHLTPIGCDAEGG